MTTVFSGCVGNQAVQANGNREINGNRLKSIEIVNLRLSSEVESVCTSDVEPNVQKTLFTNVKTSMEMLVLLDLFRSVVGSNEIKVCLDSVAKPQQWNNVFAGLHHQSVVPLNIKLPLCFGFSRVGWATAASSLGDLIPR